MGGFYRVMRQLGLKGHLQIAQPNPCSHRITRADHRGSCPGGFECLQRKRPCLCPASETATTSFGPSAYTHFLIEDNCIPKADCRLPEKRCAHVKWLVLAGSWIQSPSSGSSGRQEGKAASQRADATKQERVLVLSHPNVSKFLHRLSKVSSCSHRL